MIFRDTLDTMVPLSGVGSDLSNAMSAIVDDGFAESNGWRRNDQIPSVLVVLTDTLRDDSHYQSLVQVHSKYLNPSAFFCKFCLFFLVSWFSILNLKNDFLKLIQRNFKNPNTYNFYLKRCKAYEPDLNLKFFYTFILIFSLHQSEGFCEISGNKIPKLRKIPNLGE